MIRRSLFLLFLTLLSDARLHAIELTLDESLFRYQKLNFRVEAFVDARIRLEKPVGYTKAGISNRPEEILLPADFAKYCEGFFKNIFAANANKPSLVAVINQVTVLELTEKGNEVSDVLLSIDYYRRDSLLGGYRRYYQTFHKAVFGPVMDATKKHGKNLSEAFLASFQQVSAFASTNSNVGGELINREKLFALQVDAAASKPANGDTTQLADGIYFNAQQLLQNRPAHAPSLLVKIEGLHPENYPDIRMTLPEAQCYAFVHKGQLYLCVRTSVYHRSKLSFASRQARVLDRSQASKKGVLLNSFGLEDVPLGAVATPSGSMSKELLIDLESGCFIK